MGTGQGLKTGAGHGGVTFSFLSFVFGLSVKTLRPKRKERKGVSVKR